MSSRTSSYDSELITIVKANHSLDFLCKLGCTPGMASGRVHASSPGVALAGKFLGSDEIFPDPFEYCRNLIYGVLQDFKGSGVLNLENEEIVIFSMHQGSNFPEATALGAICLGAF